MTKMLRQWKLKPLMITEEDDTEHNEEETINEERKSKRPTIRSQVTLTTKDGKHVTGKVVNVGKRNTRKRNTS